MISKVDLKVGYLCNNDCIHCAIRENRNALKQQCAQTELTTNQVKSLIDRYCKQFDQITLTGGEITIRKDFIELVHYAAERFKIIEVQTNGRKLGQKNNLIELAKHNNIYYSIAIHGNTAEIHDSITQRKHSFDQTIQSIQQLIELPNKPKITAKFVLTNHNKHCVCQTVEMCAKLGIKRIDIAYIHGCTDDKQLLTDLLPSYQQLSESINRAIEIGEQLGVYVTLETFPLCVIDPKHFAHIDELTLAEIDSSVHPVNDKLYDWNTDRVCLNKAKKQQCLQCAVRNNCEGPWFEYWDIHNGSGLTPILPGKPAIPAITDNKAVKLAGYINVFNQFY